MSSFLDVRRNRDGFDLTRLEPALVALVEESFYRAGISCARVAVADAGGEKFDETATVALTSIPDKGREPYQTGADQRRRQHDRVGQQDRLSASDEGPPRPAFL